MLGIIFAGQSLVVKRIINATEDLDTLVYLSASSWEEATSKWLRDFAKSLNAVITVFDPLFRKAPISASFDERRSEQIHIDFLTRITEYVDAIDLIFARKALQYSKIAIKLNGPKLLDVRVLEDIKEAETYLLGLEKAIGRINRFSEKQMAIATEVKPPRPLGRGFSSY